MYRPICDLFRVVHIPVVLYKLSRFSSNRAFCAVTGVGKMGKNKGENPQKKQGNANDNIDMHPEFTRSHRAKRDRPGDKKKKKKYRDSNPAPTNTTVEVQVVGSGRAGTPCSFVVHMEHNRYLFNCGEGTQRIVVEQRLGISRITDIFVTRCSWENIGGLLGMCLTLQSNSVEAVKIHGPNEVNNYLTKSRELADLKEIDITFDRLLSVHKDASMNIESFPILPKQETLSDVDEPTAKRRCLFGPKDMTIAYILNPHQPRAKILMEKCVALGITSGPMVGVLKSGKSVTLENGTVVTPEQVTSDYNPVRPLLVVECPSLHYMDSIESNPRIQQLLTQTNPTILLVIHFTPTEVLMSSRYRDWMSKFPEAAKHLVLNSQGGGVSHMAPYALQAKLNLLEPNLFPLLPQQLHPKKYEPEDCPLPNTVFGKTNLRFTVHCSEKNRREEEGNSFIKLDHKAIQEEVLLDKEFVEEYKKLQIKQKGRSEQTPGDVVYPEIIFMGTGSSYPSSTRNVSGIWINSSPTVSFMLDCGEDTYGQIERHFGPEAPAKLKQLKAIFVSHLHADHHTGITRLAIKLSEETREKLWIIAPNYIWNLHNYLHSNVFPINDYIRHIPLEDYRPYHLQRVKPLQSRRGDLTDFKNMIGFTDIIAIPVNHPKSAHAIVIHHSDGWKLAYSGDCLPSDEFVKAGDGVDILIHEATMEDFLEEMARKKRHCTISQAIDIGQRMKAKFTLLTHFSQRYSKIPSYSSESKVGIAFDNLKVNLQTMEHLMELNHAVPFLFTDEKFLIDQRTSKWKAKKITADERLKSAASANT